MDTGTLEFFARSVEVVCTIEDHVLHNGFGCAVMEHLHSQMINTPVVRIGWPDRIHRARRRPDPAQEARHHRRRAGGKSAAAAAQKVEAQAFCGLKFAVDVSARRPANCKSEGRLRFRKRPSYLMAISRILSGLNFFSRDDHLSHPGLRRTPDLAPSVARHVMRRYPRINRTGCPSSVLSCTAWGFSCLANYFASGELLPRLFTLTCALLPKNRRCLFCDTFRHRSFSTATPACSTRHAAVWCSDFPPASPASAGLTSDHLPSAN